MSIKKLILVFPALIVLSCTIAAQDQPKKTIEHTTIKPASAASGKEMYISYCAVCHGTDGKGGGPAASALKTPPADLTVLSKNNGGKYPAMKVTSAIRGTNDLPAHGSKRVVDLIKGLKVTFHYQPPSEAITEQYPLERPVIFERFRGAAAAERESRYRRVTVHRLQPVRAGLSRAVDRGEGRAQSGDAAQGAGLVDL